MVYSCLFLRHVLFCFCAPSLFFCIVLQTVWSTETARPLPDPCKLITTTARHSDLHLLTRGRGTRLWRAHVKPGLGLNARRAPHTLRKRHCSWPMKSCLLSSALWWDRVWYPFQPRLKRAHWLRTPGLVLLLYPIGFPHCLLGIATASAG